MIITRHLFWIAIISALLIFHASAFADEQRFAPADLYEYEAFTLENGLNVILNNRGQSPSVTLRLVVNSGTNDYSCDKRELPHIVEHLMFSGYEDIGESELDGMVATMGGAWNAYTYSKRTTYDAYVYSEFLEDLIILLNMMFEETNVTAAELESARLIVNAEAGGVPGSVRQRLYQYGLYEGNAERAYRQFVPGNNEWCDSLTDADSITLEDINSYISERHRPSNMTLILVGKFDIAEYKEVLSFTFGAMQGTSSEYANSHAESVEFNPVTYNTRTSEFLGQEGYVCLEYGLPKWTSPDRAALIIIKNYLDARMFEELRTIRGLTYDPSTVINDFDSFSTMMLDASVATSDMNESMAILDDLIEELRSDGISEDWIDHIRSSKLYRTASAFESNESIADFYEGRLATFVENGEFPDLDSFYAEVTTEKTLEVARKYLTPDRELRYTSRPTLSYGGAAGLATLPLLGFVLFRFGRKKRRADPL